MRLIWTKSDLILSKFIRWGLNTDCSHFAIVFDSPAGGLMFESNLLGTHPKFYRSALKHMEVVHEIELDIPLDVEDKIWDSVIDKYDDKSYDYGAFFYFCWRALLKKLFKIPFPSKNKWAKNDSYLCDELYQVMENYVKDLKIDLAITPPHDLYELLKDTKNG